MIGYKLRRRIGRADEDAQMEGSAYTGKSKLEVVPGPRIRTEVVRKTVIDFAFGEGAETIEMARRGAIIRPRLAPRDGER